MNSIVKHSRPTQPKEDRHLGSFDVSNEISPLIPRWWFPWVDSSWTISKFAHHLVYTNSLQQCDL